MDLGIIGARRILPRNITDNGEHEGVKYMLCEVEAEMRCNQTQHNEAQTAISGTATPVLLPA